MTAAKVSVIIPCFRQGHFLRSSVESVLRQSHQSVEAVVVNDGSDDNTDQVARSFGDRILYISKPNGGLPSARNAGIAAATGEYVLFLDADDMLHEDALAWLVEAMAGRHDHLAFMGWRLFENDPLKDERPDHLPEAKTITLSYLIQQNPAPVHAFLCPRQLVCQVGCFEESLRSCEDWDLWIRLLLAGAKVVTVPRVGAYYRRYAGTMSTNKGDMLEARTEVLLRTHRQIIRDAAADGPLHRELLLAECRVLRRVLAQSRSRRLIRALGGSIQQLRKRGVRQPCSSAKRALDSMLGYRAEMLVMAVFRVIKPERLAIYRSDFR
jgi:GT2 family glycosyltransferase